MNTIISAHDKFFKLSLQELQIAKDFFQHHLPKAIQDKIDFSTLELKSESFIDEEHKAHFSDILYGVRSNNESLYLFILAEHQSTPDRFMPFRILKYMCLIWDKHLKNVEEKNIQKLPIIYPLIFYHGREKPYPFSTDLLDCFFEKSLAKEVLHNPILLIDATQISDDELKKHNTAALFQLIQKHIFTRNIEKTMEDILKSDLIYILEKTINKNYIIHMIKYLLNQADIKNISKFFSDLKQALPNEEETIMTIAEYLKLEGLVKGIEQGIQEGIQQGMQQGIQQGMQESMKKITLEETVKVMEGQSDGELLVKLLAHDEARIIIEDFLSEQVKELSDNVTGGNFFITIEHISRIASVHEDISRFLIEQFSAAIGRLNAEKLLRDQQYRKALVDMITESKLKCGISGPQLLPDQYSFRELVVLYEIFNNNLLLLANTLYLKNIPAIGDYLVDDSTEAVEVFDPVYYDTGELKKAHATVGFRWSVENQDSRTEPQIFRTFSIYRDKPEASLRRVVNLDHIELPAVLKATGIGTKVLRESLQVYDAMEIDEVTLHANIDMGAYAWAIFGFNWDLELMKKKFKKSNEAECIQRVITYARDRFLIALSDTGFLDEGGLPKTTELQNLLRVFDAYLENPLAVTPQMLAAIGKDGPYFRRDEYGNWHEESDFLKRADTDQNPVLEEHQNHKGRFHAGKLGMLGNSWYGKINLKNKQERAIIDDALKRRP